MKKIDNKSIIIGLLFGVCVMLVVGQITQSDKSTSALGSEVYDVIKAKKIEIINDEGKAVIDLRFTPDGGLVLINDNNSNPIVQIANTDTGGFCTIVDKNNKPMVSLKANPKGGLIVLFGKNYNKSAAITLNSSENGGEIRIKNKDGKSLITLEVDEHGTGKVGAWDTKGKGQTLEPGS